MKYVLGLILCITGLISEILLPIENGFQSIYKEKITIPPLLLKNQKGTIPVYSIPWMQKDLLNVLGQSANDLADEKGSNIFNFYLARPIFL